MSIHFKSVEDDKAIETLAALAKEIWYEYFPGIIGMEQVAYMVGKFQSFAALQNQIYQEGYRYFLFMDDDFHIGYIGLRTEGEKLFLSKAYLKKIFRGKGYFTHMLAFIEGLAQEEKLKSLYLTVNRHNDHTIAIYRNKGFSVAKEQVYDIGNGYVMDDYVMEKQVV